MPGRSVHFDEYSSGVRNAQCTVAYCSNACSNKSNQVDNQVGESRYEALVGRWGLERSNLNKYTTKTLFRLTKCAKKSVGQSMRLWWYDGGLESSMTPGERLLVRATQKPNIGTRSFLQPQLLQKYISCRIYKTIFRGEEKLKIAHRSIVLTGSRGLWRLGDRYLVELRKPERSIG